MFPTLKNLCLQYISMPIVEVCLRNGVLQALNADRSQDLVSLKKELSLDDSILASALSLLTSLGWIEDTGAGYRLTGETGGESDFFSIDLYNLDPKKLFETDSRRRLLALQINKFIQVGSVDVECRLNLFEGALLVPILIALKTNGHIDGKPLFSKLPDDIKAALIKLFQYKNWITKRGEFSLTETGENVLRRAEQVAVATIFRDKLVALNLSLSTQSADTNKTSKIRTDDTHVSPGLFQISAAQVGLYSSNLALDYPIDVMPLSGNIYSQLEEQSYCIRQVTSRDFRLLYKLEGQCVPKNRRMTQAKIRQRIRAYPEGQYVFQVNGKVLGVLYSQRINSVMLLDNIQVKDVDSLHVSDGSVVQLLSIQFLPEYENRNYKDKFFGFMLQRWQLLSGVDTVVTIDACGSESYNNAEGVGFHRTVHNQGNDVTGPELQYEPSHDGAVEGILDHYYPKIGTSTASAVKIVYRLNTPLTLREKQALHDDTKSAIANHTTSDAVAIVGMSCRFPGASNWWEYWENLVAGNNSVVEIPEQRWCWQDHYGDPAEDVNKTNIKYGGFIEHIDKFDPLFFNISPSEANYIDPQHRIFLEAAWHAIEDAGYDPKSLAGRDIGVYAGVSKNDYAELMRENDTPIISFLSTGTVHSILANRVSYLLDFRGKSEVVDTACSSFLVALNNAVGDIKSGVCESAVVGGVNAILSPTMYISHSKSGMLSINGVCKTFDAAADGYVRSEGVGVVFVKPLQQAWADKDNVLGVIKGVAVKHGGKANFLTAPKVSSQAATISSALNVAEVDPRTIGYVEAHGTGTPLGDPIEINALIQAYQPYLKDNEQAYCGLSSVKTNVGHLESAAGAAGLIKILLSFKQKIIPSLLHFKKINPYIKLDKSPFYIVDKNQAWQRITLDGKEYPLRAGMSSFGMGGVNAHVILEETPFTRNTQKENRQPGAGYVIPLSAKHSQQLTDYAESLLTFFRKTDDNHVIDNIAFTLQAGREAMPSRVAFIVNDYQHLITLLTRFVNAQYDKHIVFGEANIDTKHAAVGQLFDVATRWVKGEDIDWEAIATNGKACRVPLPGYPFEKRRCWFPADNHRRSDRPSSDKLLTQHHKFLAKDYFIRDHLVMGEAIVPGVKYLEVFRQFGEALCQQPVRMLKDIYWMNAIKVAQDVSVTVKGAEKEGDSYSVSMVKDQTTFCSGEVVVGEQAMPLRTLDIKKIRRDCSASLNAHTLYSRFSENGLGYGPTFNVIKRCNYNERSILCEIEISPAVSRSANRDMLEPSMMDGVFQSAAALYILNLSSKGDQLVPFHLKCVKIFRDIPNRCYVYAKMDVQKPSNNDVVFSMYLCDLQGNVIVEFEEFVKRQYAPATSSDATSPNRSDAKSSTLIPLYYKPEWIPRRLGMHSENVSAIILFDIDRTLWEQLNQQGNYAHIILVLRRERFERLGNNVYSVNPDDHASFTLLWSELIDKQVAVDGIIYKWNFTLDVATTVRLDDGMKPLLGLIQSLIYAKFPEKIRFLYPYLMDESMAMCAHASIAGFSRTLAYEYPNISLVTVGVEAETSVAFTDIVGQELNYYRNAPLNEVRYINGQRVVRVIAPYRNNSESSRHSLLKQNGVYLITGGSGGLGFIFATHLAKNYNAKIILIGRSNKSNDIDDKLKQLCSLGGDAVYFSADVTAVESLSEVIESIHAKNMRLNGVFHCAGLIEDAYIIKKSAASFDRVIAPKIQGAMNLDEVTRQEPLDFFVLFSSIASIMPNQGQCDYAAANSFLDDFSTFRNGQFQRGVRSGISLAFNWPLWKNGGIGVIKEEEEYLWTIFGMKPLDTDRGIAIFEQTLNDRLDLSVGQLIAIEGDQHKIETHLGVLHGAANGALHGELHDALQHDGHNGHNGHNRTQGQAAESRLLETLRSIVSSASDQIRDIDDDESLTDYGIDSVGFSNITVSINKTLLLDIEPTLFFDYSSISALSTYLMSSDYEHFDGTKRLAPQFPLYEPERALIDLDLSNVSSMCFQKHLSEDEFFMKDHVVEGLYNVPGACYIEMALEAGELLERDKCVYKITNNYWAKQLSTAGEAIRVDLQFFRKDNCYEYEISHTELDKKVIHALGQVHLVASNPADVNDQRIDIDNITVEAIDVEAMRRECTVTREPEEIYQFIHAEGLHVGPSFMPMLGISLNDNIAVSHLKLPDALSNTFSDYVLHPSMLTGVLQTALLNNKPFGMDNTRYIPIAVDEIVVLKKIPMECYVCTEATGVKQVNVQVRKFDAKITSMDGEVVVLIKGLSLRNLSYQSQVSGAYSVDGGDVDNKPSNDFGIDAEYVEALLKDTLSESIGLPSSQIESDVLLEAYGINSVMIVDLNRRLEKIFGSLSKTLLFEYKSIKALAAFFVKTYPAVLQKYRTDNNPNSVGTNTLSLDKDKANIAGVTQNENTESDIADDSYFLHDVTSNDNTRSYPSLSAVDEPIAIVGMSGRYPGAKNLAEFWANLKDARDCITEIPKSRFDQGTFHQRFPGQELVPERWGGFIDGIDEFDPLFFNISPREAEMVDPQERLFLEVVWETVEDAGYNYHNLKNQPTGVFVGALWQPYISLGVEQTFQGNLQRPSGLLYSIPNRVSFFFDWSGPSMAVDTACSGSLTALHLACESLKRDECCSAIAGGVNLSLASSKYLWLSHNQFLASDGKCRSFGADGDGYVPGEGVGAVYLKRLRDAVADGDRIDGVIKGTSVNHGGKTNGYTVPNPNKQAELILATLNKSGVSPEQISYVEAHGTGTALGDPIEITGLQKAFSQFTEKKQYCAIGSVKSNIGHLEAAAGIAGLTKILLQMKYNTLVASINAEELNPNVDFTGSPFVVQRDRKAWSRHQENSKEMPYCAMISSFGAGGSNAHAIVEEYYQDVHPEYIAGSRLGCGDAVIVPLSARTVAQLKHCAENLLQYLNELESLFVNDTPHHEHGAVLLEDIAYTLQVGREAMDERAVFLVTSTVDLKEQLANFVDPHYSGDSQIYSGNVNAGKDTFRLLMSDNNINKVFDEWVSSGTGAKIASLWVHGVSIDWGLLYHGRKPAKISLPTYPFKKDRYWLKEVDFSNTKASPMLAFQTTQQAVLHPLLHENTSDLYEQRYSTTFTGQELFFEKNTADGSKILSWMAYPEMARIAVMQAMGDRDWLNESIILTDIVWRHQIAITHEDKKVHIELVADESQRGDSERILFRIYSDSPGATQNRVLHAEGIALILDTSAQGKVNLSLIKAEMTTRVMMPEQDCRDVAPDTRILGDEIAQVVNFSAGANGALIELSLPAVDLTSRNVMELQPWVIGELWSVSARMALTGQAYSSDKIHLRKLSIETPCFPVALSEVTILKPFSGKMFAWVKTAGGAAARPDGLSLDDINTVDIDFFDNEGDVCAKMIGLVFEHSDALRNNSELTPATNINRVFSDISTKPSGISLINLDDKASLTVDRSEASGIGVQQDFKLTTVDSCVGDMTGVKRHVLKSTQKPVSEGDVTTVLVASLAKALYMQPTEIDIDKPFTDLGLDSIVGVEWVRELNTQYSVNINAVKVYDYPNIREFSLYLREELNNNEVKAESGVKVDKPLLGFPSSSQGGGRERPYGEGINLGAQDNSHFSDNVLQNELVNSLAKALYMNESDVDVNAQFTDMGLDSIVGVEWVQLVNAKFGTTILATSVYDYSNIVAFSHYLKNVLEEKTFSEEPDFAMVD